MFPNLEFIKTCLNAITAKFRRVKSDVNAVKSNVNAVKSDVNAVKSDVDTVKSDVNAVKSDVKAVKSGVNAVKSSKMDKSNPTGTGSFSLNRKSGTTVGSQSHAEGNRTTASGNQSHAEGSNTTASSSQSHAEGTSTTASGNGSHAEGNRTTASGNQSHAEGASTTASGDQSHAEGYITTASGGQSHAEGSNTTASGNQSHAEGASTKAASANQHAQGKYNIEDSSNTYADIIGNGISATARSNAATVDWSGNAWYAGDVYTGSTSGTNKDAGSKKLATEEYVDSAVSGGLPLGISGASVGQIVKVKEVDSSGRPTKWEPIDIPQSDWEQTDESAIDYVKNRSFGNFAHHTIDFSVSQGNGELKKTPTFDELQGVAGEKTARIEAVGNIYCQGKVVITLDAAYGSTTITFTSDDELTELVISGQYGNLSKLVINKSNISWQSWDTYSLCIDGLSYIRYQKLSGDSVERTLPQTGQENYIPITHTNGDWYAESIKDAVPILDISGASAGQIPVIKTVDTNGVPTEYSIITKDELAEAAASIVDTSLLNIIGEVS